MAQPISRHGQQASINMTSNNLQTSLRISTVTALIAPAALLVVGLVAVVYIRPEQLSSIVNRVGLWGLLVIAVFILTTHVFAPLSGVAGLLVSIKAYGLIVTMSMFYVVCMASSAINFWIARRYGRTLVEKLVGKRFMKEIEDITAANETALLVSARLLCYHLFDSVSYAVGLTAIGFRRYYVYTAIFTIPPLALQLILLRYFSFDTWVGVLFYYASFIVSGIVLAQLFRILYLRQRRRSSDGRS
jgi:uncharacterized membrane protein YdjX (TVP38/TMEM64 family)